MQNSCALKKNSPVNPEQRGRDINGVFPQAQVDVDRAVHESSSLPWDGGMCHRY
jgi:hypothetical protein